MGSEMCIRDRSDLEYKDDAEMEASYELVERPDEAGVAEMAACYACLLYTSDAADERSSVDLGGRRIIKKKT